MKPVLHRKPILPIALFGSALLLAGCAGMGGVPVSPVPAEHEGLVQCTRLFERAEQAVARHDVRDHQAHVIEGHPWLRADRWLASYRHEVEGEALAQWLELMARRAERARGHEIANLPPRARQALGDDVRDRLDECRPELVAFDRERPERLRAIREKAEVPDAYVGWRRAVGLYPVTALLVLRGIRSWHDSVHETYRSGLPDADHRYYRPAEAGDVDGRDLSALLEQAADNPMEAPLPDREQAMTLLRHYAPVFAVETQGPWDRPGVPEWREGRVEVEPAPVVYTHLGHARLGGRSLLQLNYLVWFSERPSEGPLDMLAGRLDGVHWRVTLDTDGQPLLYDSMHACGCYHMAFPGERLEATAPEGGLQEPLLVPRRAPAGDGRMVLYLESGSHYLVGLAREEAGREAIVYTFRDYQDLRSLPAADGRQSLFGSHGIVPGTQRKERWFLWHTGVRSPGAMRQWGQHATAFVGRRYFDDPGLVERHFRRRHGGTMP